MHYDEAIQWLYEHLPMYQRIGAAAYKKDLVNTIKLSNYFNHPQNHYPCIHIAGTNGKGSTSHMIASVLQEAGYKVGLYTSPHLKSFTERIKINGDEISTEYVAAFVEKHQPFFKELEPSFFEMTVMLAFQYFYEEKIDVAVVETGLGGRLDSTNIITPFISVITNIGLDHQNLLGDTIAEIAVEKAGIIKPGIPVVIGESNPETDLVFKVKATDQMAPIHFADRNWKVESFYLLNPGRRHLKISNGDLILEFETDLAGEYQLSNFITVAESLIRIGDLTDFKITQNHIEAGLSKVVKNTGLKGRWQVLGVEPTIIADTGHNVHGLRKVIDQLNSSCKGQLRMVLGFVNDKKLDEVMQLLPHNAHFYFTQPNIPRAMPVNNLAALAYQYSIQGTIHNSVNEALSSAIKDAEPHDLIFIGGSTFIVAEVV